MLSSKDNNVSMDIMIVGVKTRIAMAIEKEMAYLRAMINEFTRAEIKQFEIAQCGKTISPPVISPSEPGVCTPLVAEEQPGPFDDVTYVTDEQLEELTRNNKHVSVEFRDGKPLFVDNCGNRYSMFAPAHAERMYVPGGLPGKPQTLGLPEEALAAGEQGSYAEYSAWMARNAENSGKISAVTEDDLNRNNLRLQEALARDARQQQQDAAEAFWANADPVAASGLDATEPAVDQPGERGEVAQVSDEVPAAQSEYSEDGDTIVPVDQQPWFRPAPKPTAEEIRQLELKRLRESERADQTKIERKAGLSTLSQLDCVGPRPDLGSDASGELAAQPDAGTPDTLPARTGGQERVRRPGRKATDPPLYNPAAAAILTGEPVGPVAPLRGIQHQPPANVNSRPSSVPAPVAMGAAHKPGAKTPHAASRSQAAESLSGLPGGNRVNILDS